MQLDRLLVTGGAGFIGSSFIRYGLSHVPGVARIVNLDLLTYAADMRNLSAVENDPRYLFVQGDICDERLIEKLCAEEEIDAIVHFAAETHVDRSIDDPKIFCQTNIYGTQALLEVVRKNPHIHFHHVSTDEVYGSLLEEGYFTESSAYCPNSPYAASKAASDHFVRAYAHTYGLSTTLSHCTNNYGPCQHTEKFIPRMIFGLMHKTPLCIYGKGVNVRDWIFVDDHAEAVWTILEKGKKGETYDIGGACEKSNMQVVQALIAIFSEICQTDPEYLHALITFVPDRPGHDYRYAIDSAKLKREIHWRPTHDFTSGLKETLDWYLKNPERMVCV
jgi:dTDP-glucose 4,6-dehydratase